MHTLVEININADTLLTIVLAIILIMSAISRMTKK